MRALFLTHYFPPEVGAPQTRIAALARGLRARGDEVTVHTGFPNYPDGRIQPPYRNRPLLRERAADGTRIVRSAVYATPNAGFARRQFGHDVDPDLARHVAGVVAGSGITPVLGIARAVLAGEPGSRVTLLLANRSARDVMFAEDLADLRDRYGSRFRLLHVLSREEQTSELLSGRLDRDRLLRSLQRAAIMTSDKFKGVRCVISPGSMKISSTNADQEEAVDELEIDYGGDSVDIGFNVSYLLDVLNNLKCESVNIALGDANSSALITIPDNADFKYVVMPMRI